MNKIIPIVDYDVCTAGTSKSRGFGAEGADAGEVIEEDRLRDVDVTRRDVRTLPRVEPGHVTRTARIA